MKKLNILKKKNKCKVDIFSDQMMSLSDYKLEFLSNTKKVLENIENITFLKKELIINNRSFKKVKKKQIKKFKHKKKFKKTIKKLN